ncbi:MAG: hypothetical protein PHT54_03005 [Candidatus Nanoarchaeia archaeon]|nr:hypothetical protein [Candidatus Nanoarchaeia archaeon]
MKKILFLIAFFLTLTFVFAQEDEEGAISEADILAGNIGDTDSSEYETDYSSEDVPVDEPLEGPSYSQEETEGDITQEYKEEYNPECPEGCFYNDKCYSVGKQFLTAENGKEIYCSTSQKIEDAKASGSVCQQDFECLSFYCKDRVCEDSSITSARKIGFVNILMVILAIIILIVVIYAVKNLRLKIKKQQEGPKEQQ